LSEFFDEVEEELRTERYVAMVRTGWPYAAGAVVLVLLITLGVWGYGKHQHSEQAKASITYDQGFQAASTGDLEGADRKFAQISASAPAGYRTLALMQQAGIRVVKGKDDEAVRLLDQAAKVAPDNILGDAARYKAALLLMDTHPLAEVVARLTPLADDKRPYHLQAREALAMARLQAGKPQEAQADLGVIALAQDVSDAARQRAEIAKMMVQSGRTGILAEAAKAKPADLPPTPQALPTFNPAALAAAGAAQ
jgi:hypothetical protein